MASHPASSAIICRWSSRAASYFLMSSCCRGKGGSHHILQQIPRFGDAVGFSSPSVSIPHRGLFCWWCAPSVARRGPRRGSGGFCND